mmetsp:Transcript_16464/g.51231  ORF Transcript_16464/g.51231 Transcript_16464/m.51231 type:complete len:243 (+) Transcript_16464:767-1495(+)
MRSNSFTFCPARRCTRLSCSSSTRSSCSRGDGRARRSRPSRAPCLHQRWRASLASGRASSRCRSGCSRRCTRRCASARRCARAPSTSPSSSSSRTTLTAWVVWAPRAACRALQPSCSGRSRRVRMWAATGLACSMEGSTSRSSTIFSRGCTIRTTRRLPQWCARTSRSSASSTGTSPRWAPTCRPCCSTWARWALAQELRRAARPSELPPYPASAASQQPGASEPLFHPSPFLLHPAMCQRH